MKVRIKLLSSIAACAVATVALALSLGCAGASGAAITPSNNSPANPQSPTSASYSAASLSGTYALRLLAGQPNYGNITSTSLGTITLDGTGNIAQGTFMREYQDASAGCTASATGTYAVNADGSGTMSITLTPAGANPCSEGTSAFVLGLEVAQQGEMFLAQETDEQRYASGTGVKQ